MELNKENYCFSSMDFDEKDLLHSELDIFESLREGFRRKLESFDDENANKVIEEQYDYINHRISEIKNNINKLELNNKQDYPVNLPPFIVNEINPPMGQSEITDWGLQLLDIPKIHDLGITGQGIRIAVIGTGVDPDHPDLAGAIEKTFNTTNEPYSASNGHENGSAGVICARKNDQGILGVAPGCKLIAIKALSESGSGNLVDIIEAINIAIQEGVHIINMSLGGGGTLPALKEAVDRAAAAGILVVSSAGNSGTDNSVGYPAKYPSGFAVASINKNKQISTFSSRGPEVDVAAPGEKILTCWKDKGYATVSGTSFSGPFVSGCFALLLQAGIKPTIDLLKTSSIDIEDAGFDNKSGYGIIDAYNIIKNAVGVRCAAISELTANSITSNSLILSWTGDPSAKSYVVEMKSGEEYKKLTETDETAINVTDMTPDTVYEFRVKPICDGKESDYSSVSAKTLVTPKPTDPPKFDIIKVKQAFDLLGEFLNGLTVQNLSK